MKKYLSAFAVAGLVGLIGCEPAGETVVEEPVQETTPTMQPAPTTPPPTPMPTQPMPADTMMMDTAAPGTTQPTTTTP